MVLIRVFLITITSINLSLAELWLKNTNCPQTCTCQLEHLTETAIYRFMHRDKKNEPSPNDATSQSAEYNDVLYDNIETDLFEEKTIVRSAICIVPEDDDLITQLFDKLPEETESLTLIFGKRNISVKLSDLNEFNKLISLEILGHKTSNITVEIDTALVQLRYLNLERVRIRNSKQQIQNFVKEFSDQQITFEYVQKVDSKVHPLTMVQKGVNEEILPYEKYKERDEADGTPLFVGFKNLFLLRISNCDLNSVHWTMFDGLNQLEYLILEKNGLRFIPPFAFYGTPNLKTLSLAHNNLLDIQITDLAGLLELQYLDLSYNNFSQLSELSLPPFPNLKLANFGNNPITVVFPNTFEVMNTTDSLIIGSNDVYLSLLPNSFLGLNLLQSLTLNNLNIKLLTREMFLGMPSLDQLTLSGNITEIQYDTFMEVYKLKKLVLSHCQIRNVSMDAFIGLENLQILDLSNNKLETLPTGILDQLNNIKELFLNGNRFRQLPRDIFGKIHPKMIRLNENPWHCSCAMADWKPIIVNRIKQKIIKPCTFQNDKGVGCLASSRFTYKYLYDNSVAPKCSAPKQYLNWSVFHVMRRLLKCPEYKPRLKKVFVKKTDLVTTTKSTINNETVKTDNFGEAMFQNRIQNKLEDITDNNLNVLQSSPENTSNLRGQFIGNNKVLKHKMIKKVRKYKKVLDNSQENRLAPI